MRDGLFDMFHWNGIPIRGHWSLAIGVLYFASGRVAGALAYLLIVFIHEVGHAVLARRFGLRVHEIVIHGMGGWCRHDATDSQWQRSVVAWGGVLAQLGLALAAILLTPRDIGGFTFGRGGGQGSVFLATLVSYNLFIAAFNLLPFGHLDGVEAWKIVPLLRERYGDRLPGGAPARKKRVIRSEDGGVGIDDGDGDERPG